MSNWLYLSVAIVAEVIATSSLKAAEGFTRPGPSLIVIGIGLIVAGVIVLNIFSEASA